MKEQFAVLIDRAMSDPSRSGLRAVVEKELLHYDILFALDQAGLLKRLTFQGGTSLRLCYGAPRFSEDLDFAGGPDFTNAELKQVAEVLVGYLGSRYGLEVTVKESEELRNQPENHGIVVDKWQVSVTTSPERRDLPRQRVKLEVANVTAYTREFRTLTRNYDFLPDGYQDVLVPVETLDEIMADKLVAFPASTQRIRHRDIWDLRWLSQQGAMPKIDLVQAKIADYGIDEFKAKLETAHHNVASITASAQFRAEMERFIARDAWERTFGREGFTEFLGRSNEELFQQVLEKLYPGQESEAGFTL